MGEVQYYQMGRFSMKLVMMKQLACTRASRPPSGYRRPAN